MVFAAPFERIARKIERRAGALAAGETATIQLNTMDRFYLLGYRPTALSLKTQVSKHLGEAKVDMVNISPDRTEIEFIISRRQDP